jgi:hypothetical protein
LIATSELSHLARAHDALGKRAAVWDWPVGFDVDANRAEQRNGNDRFESAVRKADLNIASHHTGLAMGVRCKNDIPRTASEISRQDARARCECQSPARSRSLSLSARKADSGLMPNWRRSKDQRST